MSMFRPARVNVPPRSCPVPGPHILPRPCPRPVPSLSCPVTVLPLVTSRPCPCHLPSLSRPLSPAPCHQDPCPFQSLSPSCLVPPMSCPIRAGVIPDQPEFMSRPALVPPRPQCHALSRACPRPAPSHPCPDPSLSSPCPVSVPPCPCPCPFPSRPCPTPSPVPCHVSPLSVY